MTINTHANDFVYKTKIIQYSYILTLSPSYFLMFLYTFFVYISVHPLNFFVSIVGTRRASFHAFPIIQFSFLLIWHMPSRCSPYIIPFCYSISINSGNFWCISSQIMFKLKQEMIHAFKRHSLRFYINFEYQQEPLFNNTLNEFN